MQDQNQSKKNITPDEKSCGVILFREKKDQKLFLLLHYPDGHWDFVKGHVEAGESEEQTVRRELEEETGITDLEILSGFRTTLSYTYERSYECKNFKIGDQLTKEVVFFLGRTQTANIQLSHEHFDHIWLPYDEALEKITFDNAKVVFREVGEFLRG